MRTKLLATIVATASLIALQASAFAQTAAQSHPTAPRSSYVRPTGRPLYNQMSPQQFDAVGDYGNGTVSVDSAARGGIGH
jgi:hypothetical protein